MRVIVLVAARPQRSIRFRDRSYTAVVLSPEQPIAEWISELDHWIGSSTGYFVGRLVVLNLSGVTLNVAGIAHLISELSKRNIRVMGLEGVEPIQSPGLPPVLRGRGAVSNIETIESARGDAQLARSQAQEHRNEPNGTELTPLVGRTVADVERELILETLTHCGGNRTHAANVLGISLRTIRNKLNDYAGAQRRPRSAVGP